MLVPFVETVQRASARSRRLRNIGVFMETAFEGIQDGRVRLPREKVKEDLRVLVHDAEDLLKATAGDLSEKAKAARSRLATALESAKVTCTRLEEKTVAAAKATDRVVREHPYQSLGVAFGVGVLLGVLLARRK